MVLGPTETEMVDEVEMFCYLGSIVDREGEVERAFRARGQQPSPSGGSP